MKEKSDGKISIDNLVNLKYKVRLVDFDDYTLRLEVIDGPPNIPEITVPRIISALGQNYPESCWKIPAGRYELTKDFNYTGKYIIKNRIEQAELSTKEEMDNLLQEYIGTTLDGGVILGRVVYIYALYIQKGEQSINDVEFFDNTDEASHDWYAYQVYVVIQDLGNSIEYPVNFKLLKKV